MTKFQRFLLKIAYFFFPYKIYNFDNMPDGKAVIVSNHFSFVDPIFFLRLKKNDTIHILAKKELFEKKFISKFLKGFNGIPIDRENPGINSIIQVTKALKNGGKVGIFPEGTRNKTKSNLPLNFKGGSVVFALKAKCPIVPVMMLKKARLFRKTRIIVGKPIYLDEYYDKKLSVDEINDLGTLVRNKMIEIQTELNTILNGGNK